MTGAATTPDVFIAGGGLIGLTMALALARAGFEVTVVDPISPLRSTDDRFDGRATALAASSVRMLETLGIWRHLSPHAQPINDIIVSDGTVANGFREGGPAPFILHFDPRELSAAGRAEPLGFMVENRHIRRGLYAALSNEPAVELTRTARVSRLLRHEPEARGLLDDGHELRAVLCVAADGKASPLRQAAGIKTVRWPYAQAGIVTTVRHDQPHDGIAQEYFLSAGPFAILPLTGNRSSLVWTERADLVPVMMALDDAAFADQVARRFGSCLGEVTTIGPRWSYPLELQLARSYVVSRMALIGDAAHAIHPIAGQGLNLGLRDVAALAEVLIDARRLGLDIGSLAVLERYQQWRRFDNVLLAFVTDGLNRLFSNDVAPLRLARDIGLQAVGSLGPMRRFLMRHAMGLEGELPRLLKGEAL